MQVVKIIVCINNSQIGKWCNIYSGPCLLFCHGGTLCLLIHSIHHLYIITSYVYSLVETLSYCKRKNFAVEIFSLYSRAPLHRENIVREMSLCFSRASFATAAQSCLHSPLPRSHVYTRHCRVVVSSLATATQSCFYSPLPRSRVFTRHCQWSTETLQCLRNSLARDTMSTM